MSLHVTATTISNWYGWSRTTAWRTLKAMEREDAATGSKTVWRARDGRTLYTTRRGLEEHLRRQRGVDNAALLALAAENRAMRATVAELSGRVDGLALDLRNAIRRFQARP